MARRRKLALDHVALRVADLDRAVDFYTQRLGLRLLFREVDDRHQEAFAFLAFGSPAGGTTLELLQSLAQERGGGAWLPARPAEPFCPHIALATPDLDAMRERLIQDEIPILKGPLEIPGKVRWLYAADPDNNVLEFVQWLEP